MLFSPSGKPNWQTWGWSTGGLIAVGMAMQVDDKVRNEIQFNEEMRKPAVADIGNSWAELGGIGVAGALLGAGWYSDDKAWLNTSKVMLWSSMVGATGSRIGKYVGGRMRPYQAGESGHWFENGGESFPSGHTTQAFALSTAYAESVPNPSWQRRLFAYSLALSTAYARMYDDKHWLSDTVAGALVGTASALLVVKYDLANKGTQLLLTPGQSGGVGVTAVKTW